MLDAPLNDTVIQIPPAPPERRGFALGRNIKQKGVMGFFTELAEQEGSFASLKRGRRNSVVFNDATAIDYVFKAGNSKGPIVEFLRPVAGLGVFLETNLPAWGRMRHYAQPFFTPKSFDRAGVINQMVLASNEMLERWQEYAPKGRMAHLDKEFPSLAFSILLRGLFNETDVGIASEMKSGIDLIFQKAGERIWKPIKVPASWVYAAVPKYRRARRTLFKAAKQFIDRRREALKDPNFEHKNDLLSQMIGHYGLSRTEQRRLVHEVITYLIAGYETTGQALTFASILLSQNPDAQRKIAAEADRVFEGRLPVPEDVRKLTETGRIVKEALRLVPPVPILRREAMKDLEIPLDDGRKVFVPQGTIVSMSPWAVHRLPQYWGNDPEKFNPDHFSREATANRHKSAFFPFALGERKCIGGPFAETEMTVVLALVASRFEFTIPDAASIKPEFSVLLHPDKPVLAELKPRNTVESRL